MAEIIWTLSALKDLKEIHQYISKDSVFYANRYIAVLLNRVEILIGFPLIGRMVPEKEDETIRELIEGNYRIFYKVISKNKVRILRIHHAAKNIK
jgi:toxin ParE1/3/4